MRVFLLVGAVLVAGLASIASRAENAAEDVTIIQPAHVEWEHLNPLRGDKGPSAGPLWGDRTGPGPAGFLLKPADGFRSPPHIHNIPYRGVVIRGLVHNDAPEAPDNYMPPGSHWTQPAGHVHVTASKGADTLAYIEVDDAFGVLPKEQAFESGEAPINIDVNDIEWTGEEVRVAELWTAAGDARGTLVKLPDGFSGKLVGPDGTVRAVVIQGRPTLRGKGDATQLEPGSYLDASETIEMSSDEGESVLYLRSKGPVYFVKPGEKP